MERLMNGQADAVAVLLDNRWTMDVCWSHEDHYTVVLQNASHVILGVGDTVADATAAAERDAQRWLDERA